MHENGKKKKERDISNLHTSEKKMKDPKKIRAHFNS